MAHRLYPEDFYCVGRQVVKTVFYNVFGVFHRLLRRNCSCHASHFPSQGEEFSEIILQNIFNKLPPQTVCPPQASNLHFSGSPSLPPSLPPALASVAINDFSTRQIRFPSHSLPLSHSLPSLSLSLRIIGVEKSVANSYLPQPVSQSVHEGRRLCLFTAL